MATNRAMLKEAIADAKAVKETAIANAKAALEEAFTPQLKSMFAAKLQEMDQVDEIEDKMDEMKHKESMEEENENKMMEVDLEELLAELELEESTISENLYEDEDEDLSDDELKEMIEDVIAQMVKDGEIEAGPEFESEDEDEDKMDMDMNMDMKSEDNEEDLEEVDLAELLREIEEMDNVKEVEKVDEMSSEGASDLSAIIGIASVFTGIGIPILRLYFKQRKADKQALMTLKDDIKGLSPEQAEKKISDEIQKASQSESQSMDPELEEAYSTIDELKSELNEINLLNAKLLYTNKIFKAKTLNESQKVKVLSSFDKATTVNEVKLVFETLNEGIKVKPNLIKENLGRASKGTMTHNVKTPIVESNEAFLRMQKLAGII